MEEGIPDHPQENEKSMTLEEMCLELKRALDQKDEYIQRLHNDQESFENETKRQNSEIKRLREEMQKYRVKYERLRTKAKEQNFEVKRLYQEIEHYKAEIERLGTKVEKLYQENAKYHAETETLRAEAKEQALEIKRLCQRKSSTDNESFEWNDEDLTGEDSKSPNVSQMTNHPEFAPVLKKYNIGQLLGEGSNGEVRMATRKSDNATVAIKIIALSSGSKWIDVPGRKGKVPLEVGLLKRVCAVPACQSIIQMHEYILRRKYIFIFMELLESSMSLEDYIYKNIGPMNEEKAKHAFRQIVQAVLHCHSRGVFHNDIKPNNIMYQTTTGQIKLIDFGYGDLLHEEKYKYAPGTLEYWPPEWCLFKKYKAEPVTVWTLGVTLFELLCGKMPFKGKLEIMECKIFITREVSVDCKDIIEKCLCFRPRDRPTLKDILNHPWLC
ncbi:serine/threonine-protein kinase pim-2-like [Polypterus senegalus]|uniref:serine/threonine-protein kinase pim-2-like n=1 Tax=Polypterus senegalus TaxID=55291 RepID=UPI001965BFBA|nr:serine/threonine-protein kinase pim-2-like [Polypterus senegalus]